MTYALRIFLKHPGGPEFCLLQNGQRIASGRVNKSAVADLVLLWFAIQRYGDKQ